MVKLIAHRGNIDGPDAWKENDPEYVQAALDAGFDVEVDVWFNNNNGVIEPRRFAEPPTIRLGHDCGSFEVDLDFLLQDGIWCHAKNVDAFMGLKKAGAHVFWTDTDGLTLTTRGVLWMDINHDWLDYYAQETDIAFVDLTGWNSRVRHIVQKNVSPKYAICSDYVGRLKELYEGER